MTFQHLAAGLPQQTNNRRHHVGVFSTLLPTLTIDALEVCIAVVKVVRTLSTFENTLNLHTSLRDTRIRLHLLLSELATRWMLELLLKRFDSRRAFKTQINVSCRWNSCFARASLQVLKTCPSKNNYVTYVDIATHVWSVTLHAKPGRAAFPPKENIHMQGHVWCGRRERVTGACVSDLWK